METGPSHVGSVEVFYDFLSLGWFFFPLETQKVQLQQAQTHRNIDFDMGYHGNSRGFKVFSPGLAGAIQFYENSYEHGDMFESVWTL